MPSNLVRCSDDEEYSLLDSLLKKSRSLPENVCVYQNQVGGHGALGNKHGVLYSKELGIVYKPIQHFPKGFHEVDLYERVFNSSRGDEKLSVLRQFMPRYDGLCCDASGKNSYICMEDILADLKRPAICDIKVGRITYTPDATPEKISVEKSKYKWQEEIGFSVTGIKVYDSATGEDVYVDKTHCRTLDPSNIYEHGIRLFLCKDIARARRLASSFVKSLSELCRWFEIQLWMTMTH
ncbi:unnamed protein product [Calicophoron daubneyi]|uniref:Kinase n=1 Tax=Calicophoron daubneyi TaxID=300641 RepID=A0AAV2T7D5_CALDB